MLTKNKNYLLIGIYLSVMFIGPMILAPIIMLIRGYSLEYFLKDGFLEDGFIGVSSIVMFIIYAILCGVLLLLTRDVFKQDFKKIDSCNDFFKQMGIGLACTFGAAIFGNTILSLLGTTDTAANQEAVEAALASMPFLMIITITFLGPVAEEIIFRLVLMNLFNWKPIYNVIFSSLIFGLIHVLVGGLIHIIPYFLMGLVFGYLYLKNNNIWHVTVLHILHNGLTIMIMLLAQFVLNLYYS